MFGPLNPKPTLPRHMMAGLVERLPRPDHENVYWPKVVAGFHFDGANGSTLITDVRGHTAVALGTTRISTAQSKFGGSSCFFDGSSNSGLQVVTGPEFAIGTGDFTISFWLYPTIVGGQNKSLLYKYVSWSSNADFALRLTASGKLQFLAGAGAAINLTGATTLAANAWRHIEVSRAGGTLRMFLDGVPDLTAVAANPIPSNSSMLRIGHYDAGSAEVFSGYMDDLQFMVGVAQHTGNFPPPDAPFFSM